MTTPIRKGDTVKDGKGTYYKVCQVHQNGDLKIKSKGVVKTSTVKNVSRVA